MRLFGVELYLFLLLQDDQPDIGDEEDGDRAEEELLHSDDGG